MSVAVTLPNKAAPTVEALVYLGSQMRAHVVFHVAESVVGALTQFALQKLFAVRRLSLQTDYTGLDALFEQRLRLGVCIAMPYLPVKGATQ